VGSFLVSFLLFPREYQVLFFKNVSTAKTSYRSADILKQIGLIDYFVMCVTYIFFYRACQAQGLERNNLPYKGYFQPYCAYIAAVWLFVVTCMYGYTCYLPWSVSSFFSQYSMQLFIPPLFVVWKVLKKTKMVKAHEADLTWQRPIIDAYEATFIDPPSGFWSEMGQLVGMGRSKGEGGQDRRRSGSVVVV
jgi:amino acid transporter